MSNKLTYKDYSGSMELSLEDDCLFGKIQDINDIIAYEGNTVSELKAAFEVAVDEYLQICSENNKETVQIAKEPYKQTFFTFRPLDQETRSHVETACAAYHLSRAPQTLRKWACYEDGPIRPIRITGRLAWPIAEIRRLLNGGAK